MTENEELKARVAELEAMLSDSKATLPTEWKLSRLQEKIFRILLAREVVSRAAINESCGLHARTADVHIHRIRRKLARFGIVIETINARGWKLVGRFTWQRALDAQAAT